MSNTIDKELTIFITSYNRKEKLYRALGTIFTALNHSRYKNSVTILVVDDYSTENVKEVVDYYRQQGNEIEFLIQEKRCGVSEIAFMSCLKYISTKFAWVIGNDDQIIDGSIDYLFSFLHKKKPSSFYLLNFLGLKKNGQEYYYYTSRKKEIRFPSGYQLFLNFGFATATTTTPCLCFEVEPLRKLDLNSFIEISPIYSQTFAFFIAYENLPCSFIPKPLVIFNHNEAKEEQDKLESKNYYYNHVSFFHATIGFVRHLNHISKMSGHSLAQFARFREDELNKDNFQVETTTSAFFIYHYSISQLIFELDCAERKTPCIRFSQEEIEELETFFENINIPELANLFQKVKNRIALSTFSIQDQKNMLYQFQIEGIVYAKKYVLNAERKRFHSTSIKVPFSKRKIISLS